MRHFAENCARAVGPSTTASSMRPDERGSFHAEVARAVKRNKPERIVVTEPGEWRVLEDDAKPGSDASACRSRSCADDALRLLDAGIRAPGRGPQATAHGILLSRDAPQDRPADGRRRARGRPVELRPREPQAGEGRSLHAAAAARSSRTRSRATSRRSSPARFADHFGDLEPFWFAVTRADAEEALDHFISDALPRFGDFQDAMLEGENFLYHSVLSIYLNSGLLDPLDVCRAAEADYRAGACRSTPPKASSARSSAGANMCAASTG